MVPQAGCPVLLERILHAGVKPTDAGVPGVVVTGMLGPGVLGGFGAAPRGYLHTTRVVKTRLRERRIRRSVLGGRGLGLASVPGRHGLQRQSLALDS